MLGILIKCIPNLNEDQRDLATEVFDMIGTGSSMYPQIYNVGDTLATTSNQFSGSVNFDGTATFMVQMILVEGRSTREYNYVVDSRVQYRLLSDGGNTYYYGYWASLPFSVNYVHS